MYDRPGAVVVTFLPLLTFCFGPNPPQLFKFLSKGGVEVRPDTLLVPAWDADHDPAGIDRRGHICGMRCTGSLLGHRYPGAPSGGEVRVALGSQNPLDAPL